MNTRAVRWPIVTPVVGLQRMWRVACSADPRLYQIAVLATLLFAGLTVFDFAINLSQVAATIATALITQWLMSITKNVNFDPRSPLISSLSLCLLLRVNHWGWAAAAAAIAIVSKFVIRWRDKHVFNPANGAIGLLLLLGAPVWVSPGQWGNIAVFAFALAAAGSWVVTRAARVDTTLLFLLMWIAALLYRSHAVNEPISIPLHRMESGSLILFSFFMVSDPKTSPNAFAGRIVYCLLVVVLAFVVQFKLFATNGLLWGLFFVCPLVPIIDAIFAANPYRWSRRRELL